MSKRYAERKRPNKKQSLTDEEWEKILALYIEGHSITTLCVQFKVSFERVRQGLLDRGQQIRNWQDSKALQKRKEIIPQGRFTHSDFYKK